MKKIFLFVALSFTMSLKTKCQNNKINEELLVQKTIIEMFQALADLNIEEVKRNCTPDIKIYENGTVWNLDTLIAKLNIKRGRDFKRINKLDFIETEVEENIAWTTYYNQADISLNGKAMTIKWLESAILLKEGEEWKMKLLHSTVMEKRSK